MTPAQLHMHLEVLFNAGMLPIFTVSEPGAQGALVTGTQGMGVNTPKAVAVADATVGFAMEEHIPNVGMLTMGLLSMMLAAGAPAITLLSGKTFNAAGAAPKLHVIKAPEVTSSGMRCSWLSFGSITQATSRKKIKQVSTRFTED